ncbi:MATH and LRR domain-containing protein PFE0570w-like [Maniola hyperantus]|uniref:MATH and LRR domain-containing protein PFE0570w-like n=1 Tax=Aphantopus hyperantus TaxID=2795564 RepID=UPI00374821FB
MTWCLCLILSSLVNIGYCINRPVFKIVLTQKGFRQFLQYDVETPPIREFTFCTWLRVFDLSHDQSVFTYVGNGNNRVIQLWLDSGGKFMKISLNGRTFSSTLVDITENTWRHACLSYQSDFGAWAIYMDGRLASCEAAQSLYGFVLPGGGSIIIGYGTTNNGITHGLEGEIFGANMILKSTIERNYTVKKDPQYEQKLFHKNRLLGNNNNKYIVLNDMDFDISETTKLPFMNTTRSFIKFKSIHGSIEHDVGLDLIPKKTKFTDSSNEKEILDFTRKPNIRPTTHDNEKINFWNLLNQAGNIGKLKGHNSKAREQSGSGTHELPNISEYEIPPPPVSFNDYTRTSVKIKNPFLKTSFEIKENEKLNHMKIINENKYEISEVVKPPPKDKNTKVYGQWTSSQFANSVLNYLKNTNFENKKLKKVPSTIPLVKFSDTFPYASDYKVIKVQPFKFERRNFKTNIIHKRNIIYPQINVEILKDDIRTQILESHAKSQPKDVEIINRGQTMTNNKYYRFYRNVDKQISSETNFSSENLKPAPFAAASKINSMKAFSNSDLYKNSNLMAILPFLKSAEYFVDEFVEKKFIDSNEMYTKSLSNANKWHNIKSYNNDYTPRRINMESGEIHTSINKDIFTGNKKHPSLRLKYRPDSHKVVKNIDEADILNGRNLALEISDLSNTNPSSISILKHNHGSLPDNKVTQSTKKPDSNVFVDSRNNKVTNKNNFNQNVKIGNALNERYIIGDNVAANKISFIGGLEKIPDINRYRSDIDHVSEIVPPSLGPKVCKNVELYDRLLYVQLDGSVDVTHILSPVKENNFGIEFIIQNYKKCSLEESVFETNAFLLIDWSKTPVRLFGGSYPKKTTDLCGFF